MRRSDTTGHRFQNERDRATRHWLGPLVREIEVSMARSHALALGCGHGHHDGHSHSSE